MGGQSNQINITNGVTFKYFYLGFISTVLSILWITLSNFLPLLGIIPLLASVFLLLSIYGTSIDLGNKKIRSYLNIFFLKFGKWTDLNDYIRVELLLNNHSQALNSRGMTHTVKVQSYHISLVHASKKRIELKEFTDYKEAQKMLTEISNQLGIEKMDRIALIKKSKAKR